jgi:hypothetical protein
VSVQLGEYHRYRLLEREALDEKVSRLELRCQKGCKIIYCFVAHHLLWNFRKDGIERLISKQKMLKASFSLYHPPYF